LDNIVEERNDLADPSAPMEHVHDYYGRTTMDLDHFHTFDGTTGLNYETGRDHVHRFANETSRAHGHTHRMHGNSSRQIPAFWGHVHQIAGITSFDDGHTHRFDVLSGLPHRPRSKRPRLVRLFRASSRDQEAQSENQPATPGPRRRGFSARLRPSSPKQ
jgi:hypothetical protein